METLLPRIRFTALPKKKEVWLEIGFGAGEHLAAQAENHPHIHFIGAEVFANGIAACLQKIDERRLENIQFFTSDARELLSALPDHSISRVFILFPDPWPKARHHKRRIISHETLSMLARIMKKGAELRIATDHTDYLHWILVQMQQSADFEWLAEVPADWQSRPDHVKTRYQAKAEKEGRTPIFLDFRRV